MNTDPLPQNQSVDPGPSCVARSPNFTVTIPPKLPRKKVPSEAQRFRRYQRTQKRLQNRTAPREQRDEATTNKEVFFFDISSGEQRDETTSTDRASKSSTSEQQHEFNAMQNKSNNKKIQQSFIIDQQTQSANRITSSEEE